MDPQHPAPASLRELPASESQGTVEEAARRIEADVAEAWALLNSAPEDESAIEEVLVRLDRLREHGWNG